PQRPPVIQKWHGHEVMSKHRALDPDKREDGRHARIVAARYHVEAFVAENVPHESLPCGEVADGPAGLPSHKGVPFGARILFTTNDHESRNLCATCAGRQNAESE